MDEETMRAGRRIGQVIFDPPVFMPGTEGATLGDQVRQYRASEVVLLAVDAEVGGVHVTLRPNTHAVRTFTVPWPRVAAIEWAAVEPAPTTEPKAKR